MFFRRFYQAGALLSAVSILQVIFRRSGDVLLSLKGFPLVFSTGLNEAILLWVRFMIIFELAHIFARVSLFEFILLLNKARISIRFSLLLLTALRFIPFIYDEAKKGLWTIRFRGTNIRKLKLKEKYNTFRKLMMPLLFRGIHYASVSSMALELRGYGAVDRVRIPRAYPLKLVDASVLLVLAIVNIAGIILF